ncbi:uncharacterized protein [Palaemon carinicauda]|uniref:uncharacterized protein n=1 Tax=Palaemon carinicauda TaxID=392227 RepID=UPI0035B66DFE
MVRNCHSSPRDCHSSSPCCSPVLNRHSPTPRSPARGCHLPTSWCSPARDGHSPACHCHLPPHDHHSPPYDRHLPPHDCHSPPHDHHLPPHDRHSPDPNRHLPTPDHHSPARDHHSPACDHRLSFKGYLTVHHCRPVRNRHRDEDLPSCENSPSSCEHRLPTHHEKFTFLLGFLSLLVTFNTRLSPRKLTKPSKTLTNSPAPTRCCGLRTVARCNKQTA